MNDTGKLVEKAFTVPDDMICSLLSVLQYCAITGEDASIPSRTTT